MLNVGQVVYDYTNERIMIFAGIAICQNQETGECHTEAGFILKDGTFIRLKKGITVPFKYTNFIKNGKPFCGSFIAKCQCDGCYFGIIDGNNTEVKAWAKKAIKETEVLITKHGLNKIEEKCGGKRCLRCYIGQIIEYKPKMTISTPSIQPKNRKEL